MTIQGKIILITGASKGIGLAAAKLLAEKGATVVLSARSKDALEAAQREIPGSHVIVADMMDEDDIKRMITETVTLCGRIDVLINNAGQGLYASIEQVDLDEYSDILELNVLAPLIAMQAVIPHMRSQGGGMIVNISSMVSKMHIPGLGAYASTKYALNALTHTAAVELAKDKINVIAVLPGRTDTDFGKNSLGGGASAMPALRMENMPPADSVEKVADAIADAIESERPETLLVQM
jgi:short-subunit dehydrogenase